MSKKLTHEYVKSQFEKAGHIPKFTEYINNYTKLDFICPNGHHHSMTWAHWTSGNRCGKCKGNIEVTHEDVKKSLKYKSYELISKVYVNAHTKLECICPNGHKYYITWNNWRKGAECFECFGSKKLTIDFIKEEFEKEGYILLSTEYINNSNKLNYICPNGHVHSISWNNWQAGKRCKKCNNNGTSNFEKEVKQFIIDQGIDIIENDRTTIKNTKTNYFLELDILFQCKTKAIECNGIYWHDRPEAIEKDLIKQKQCKELGINLLVITDEEWTTNQIECQDKIKRFIVSR